MSTPTSSDEVLTQVRTFNKVAVLLYSYEDELCARAKGSLPSFEDKLRGLGFTLYYLEVDGKSALSEELACVRVPQLRLFSQGKLVHKLVGTIDEYSINSLVRSLQGLTFETT